MDPKQRKPMLRDEMLVRLRAQEFEAAAAAASAALRWLTQESEFQRCARLALFAALPDEIPTRSFFDSAQSAGKTCLFPRCNAVSALDFACVEAWEDLLPGRYGVLEPRASASAECLGEGDLVIVPGLAFDRQGFRLGRGGGFYDRSFPPGRKGSPILFGLGYAFQLMDQVPREEHDCRVDAILTEAGLHQVGEDSK